MQSLYAATATATPAWASSRSNVRVAPSAVRASAAMPGMGLMRRSGAGALSAVSSRRTEMMPGLGLGMMGLGVRRRRDAARRVGFGGGWPVRAQAAAGGAAVPSQAPKKILGIEATTFKKVIPLGLMFFCILFNYTILRDTKDVLVVTAKGSSAEIIPFLKTWVNLPMAIGFMVIYTKLSNVLSKENLFYSCIFPFIAFFGAFAFFMYPLVDVLHPTAFADWALQKLGTRFMGPIAIIRNWTFVLFYVMAELWGSVVVSVLFWGFANQVRIFSVCVSGNALLFVLSLCAFCGFPLVHINLSNVTSDFLSTCFFLSKPISVRNFSQILFRSSFDKSFEAYWYCCSNF
jgi:hypothetical protein